MPPRGDMGKCPAEYFYDSRDKVWINLTCELDDGHTGDHLDYYEADWS